MGCLLTIDWEAYFCFKKDLVFWEANDPLIEEPTYYLLDLLRRHDIKAIWYCLGWLEDKKPDLMNLIEKEGHVIGYHSYYHVHSIVDIPNDGRPYRAPKFKGEKRLYSGGFWFRVMPYSWIKREVQKTGIFYIHPHDLLFEHPDCGNPLKTFERRLGLKTSRDKLERLVREVEWDEPRS